MRGSKSMGQANHYEGIRENEETDAEVIARVITAAGVHLIKNDIFVVKTLIAEDKYSFTAYTYDGENWCAMDGNYNAENIYFDKDFTVTEKIGTITTLTNGQATLAASGKNLKQVLATLLASEKYPSKLAPTLNITASHNQYVEAGTTVTPKYNVTITYGAYTYGPAVGATATFSSTDSLGNNGGTLSNITYPDLVVGDDTSYYETSTATYTDGAVPVTNLGNEYPDAQLKAGTVTQSSGKTTSYRSFFYGVVKTDTLDSATIRALTNGGNYGSSKTLTVNVTSDDGVGIVVAIPTSNTRSGLTKALLTTSMNADITADYVKSDNVNVEGVNGYTAVPYKIYFYKPAKLTSGQTHQITLG